MPALRNYGLSIFRMNLTVSELRKCTSEDLGHN